MPHLRVKNLDALVIYQAPAGGWIADIVLKKVPSGIGDVIGTPGAAPLPSRSAAWAKACDILAAIIEAERLRKAGGSGLATALATLNPQGWA